MCEELRDWNLRTREGWETPKAAATIKAVQPTVVFYPFRAFFTLQPEQSEPVLQEETSGALDFMLPSGGNFTWQEAGAFQPNSFLSSCPIFMQTVKKNATTKPPKPCILGGAPWTGSLESKQWGNENDRKWNKLLSYQSIYSHLCSYLLC